MGRCGLLLGFGFPELPAISWESGCRELSNNRMQLSLRLPQLHLGVSMWISAFILALKIAVHGLSLL